MNIVEAKIQPNPKSNAGEIYTVRRVMTTNPDPTFNGYRFILVEGNIIPKVRYMNLAEVRAADFKLAWVPTGDGPVYPRAMQRNQVRKG